MLFSTLFNYRKFRLPRKWSNRELKKIAHLFDGEIINVSGWDDRDKEGGFYCGYFSNAKAYYISNYQGKRGIEESGGKTNFDIDLEATLPDYLINRFDVVFNHTTLEHVFNIFQSFKNLCLLSRDIVIVIVPFTQQVHISESFSDFWRFTPHAIRRLFNENNMDIIYLTFNNTHNSSNYIFAVGSRNPEKWRDKMPPSENKAALSDWIGEPSWLYHFKRLFAK